MRHEKEFFLPFSHFEFTLGGWNMTVSVSKESDDTSRIFKSIFYEEDNWKLFDNSCQWYLIFSRWDVCLTNKIRWSVILRILINILSWKA